MKKSFTLIELLVVIAIAACVEQGPREGPRHQLH